MPAPTGFRLFKAAAFALLAANLALYALLGRPSEIVDAAAWLVLLVLFVKEPRTARMAGF